jgi:hypothetical protein
LASKVALSFYREKTNTRDEERYHRTKKAALKQQLIASGWQVAPPVVQAKA